MRSVNRKRLLIVTVVLLIAAIFVVVFHAPRKQDDAIRAALENYLSQRNGLNMAGMDVEIKNVKAEGDHAEAQVEFRAKGGDARMQMTYQFVRQGDTWVVQGSSGTASSGHPAISEGMPDGTPGALSPGHPAVSATPAVPPVHGTGNPPPPKP